MQNGTAADLGSDVANSTVKRTRAPAACTACRSRRTKCLLRDGAASCSYCHQNNLQCIIRNDDERKRPTSKAYVNALTARIELLENMLQELGQTPPPLDAGPFGSAGQPLYAWAQAANGGQKPYTASYGGSNTSVDSVDDGAETAVLQPELAALREPMRHADLDRASPIPEGSWKLNTPLQAVARTLNQEQQDYLMVLYWTKYNHVVNLIPEASFREDQEAGKGLWYSEFLHVCAMAVGSRFVDSAWPGRRKIMSGGRETLIHKIAKDILERGGEKPSGLPMVLALLLLGDLECGVGRLESGWTYGRRASELMLALDKPPGDPGSETYQRSMKRHEMVLWACILSDHFWTIFFNRPTGIKDADLLSCQIDNCFGSLNISRHPNLLFGSDYDKYESLAELTRLMMRVMQLNTRNIDERRLSAVTSLDGQLRQWYGTLEGRRTWMPENIAGGLPCFFLERQYYHAGLIILHWRPAQYTTPYPSSSSTKPDSTIQLFTMSRDACLASALQLADLLNQGRLVLAATKVFRPCLLRALIAAAALVASTAVFPELHTRLKCLHSLQNLIKYLGKIAQFYQPAERISQGLSQFLRNSTVGLKALSGPDSCFANTMFALSLPTTATSQEMVADTQCSTLGKDAWADISSFIADNKGMAQIVAHAHNLETANGDTLNDVDSFVPSHGQEPRDNQMGGG